MNDNDNEIERSEQEGEKRFFRISLRFVDALTILLILLCASVTFAGCWATHP